MKEVLSIVCLLGSVALSLQKSTPEDTHYVAAVLEYHHDPDTMVNLRNYVDYIRQAAEQNADIAVFSEMTLTRKTPVAVPFHGLLKDFPTPALRPDLYDDLETNDSGLTDVDCAQVLVQLSQAAREHQIYVMVNVEELMDCSSRSSSTTDELCPSREVYKFNTNVIFDRSGSVIDRYRKINPFGEYSRSAALQDDLGVFSTDFGVTFGHFICFDLMFQVPAIQVLQKYNIRNVVYSTMWFSMVPFFTAIDLQQSYAYTNDINLLVSGASNVAFGSGGSGIYSGKAGALISTMPGVNTRKLLVSRVPKVPGNVEGISYPGALPNDPKEEDILLLKRDYVLPTARKTHAIGEREDVQQFVLKDGDARCNVKVQLKDLKRSGEEPLYKYRAVITNGAVTVMQRIMGTTVCAVIACLTDDPESCGNRIPNASPKHEIVQLEVTLVSRKPKYNETLECNDALYTPLSLLTTKFPLATENYTYRVEAIETASIYHDEKDHDGQQRATMALVKPQKDIFAFGVRGRIFSKDVDHRGDGVDEATKLAFQQYEDSL